MKMETIRPSSLAKRGTDVDATGVYDWQKQAYLYDNCAWGTTNYTRNGTVSGVCNVQDDSTSDSMTD